MKKIFFRLLIVASLFAACSKDGNNESVNNNKGGNSGTGSIKVENRYTGSAYGSISAIAVINSGGGYVKTSAKSIGKGSDNTIGGITPGTYTVTAIVHHSLGAKIVNKEGVKITSGGTTTVVYK